MPYDDSDVGHLCECAFASCLEFAESLVTANQVIQTDERRRLAAFMTKVHYGTATLTHFASYGDTHYYTSDRWPDYVWKQETRAGALWPQPMRFALKTSMLDRFWEIVVQHTAALHEQEEMVKQEKEDYENALLVQKEARKGGG